MMLSFIGTSIGFLISLLTLIFKLSKNKKVRKTAEQMLLLTEELNHYILKAEEFSHYSGEEKKNYVLTKLNQFSMEKNIHFDEEVMAQKIDELVNLTKHVNAEETRKDWL